MTRWGGPVGCVWGWGGVQGISGGDMTRKGLGSTKSHDDTGLRNPPQKKKFQKIFRGSNFFFKKKFFAGFGGFCHHGFLVQNQTRVIMGFHLVHQTVSSRVSEIALLVPRTVSSWVCTSTVPSWGTTAQPLRTQYSTYPPAAPPRPRPTTRALMGILLSSTV